MGVGVEESVWRLPGDTLAVIGCLVFLGCEKVRKVREGKVR